LREVQWFERLIEMHSSLVQQQRRRQPFSIFFHDAIYNAKSNKNEEDSADLWMSFIRDIIDETNDDDGDDVCCCKKEALASQSRRRIIYWQPSLILLCHRIMTTTTMMNDDVNWFLDADTSVSWQKHPGRPTMYTRVVFVKNTFMFPEQAVFAE